MSRQPTPEEIEEARRVFDLVGFEPVPQMLYEDAEELARAVKAFKGTLVYQQRMFHAAVDALFLEPIIAWIERHPRIAKWLGVKSK